MKKIVFSDIPMKKELTALSYSVDGNSKLDYAGKVIFPINAVLAKKMAKGDKVKVVLLTKDDVNGNNAINAGVFQKELNELNRSIGAEIEYVTIATPFEETRDVHERTLRDMIGKLEDSAEVYGDTTYGPKPLPIIMFMAMNFAEKFFDAKIENIVYGKVDFIDGNPVNPVLYDLAPLYYLNSVINSMECNSSVEALNTLDALLSI